MSSIRIFLCGALIACSIILVGPLLAETKDVFAFIPAGGRTLLAQVVTSHPPADELQAIDFQKPLELLGQCRQWQRLCNPADPAASERLIFIRWHQRRDGRQPAVVLHGVIRHVTQELPDVVVLFRLRAVSEVDPVPEASPIFFLARRGRLPAVLPVARQVVAAQEFLQRPVAELDLLQSLQVGVEDAVLHEHLGDVYAALGQKERARQAYQRALDLDDADNRDQVRRKLDDLDLSTPR